MAIPLGLAGVVLWQTALFRETTSGTFDEGIYLRLGLQAYHHADFAEIADLGVAPLPVLLSYWLPALTSKADDVPPSEFPRVIRLARISHVLVIALPLVLFLYAWIARRRGYSAASVAGAMLAFSPTVLALSAVAVTDACFALCALMAIGAVDRYLRRPSRGGFVLIALGFGVALASKYSAVILLPVVLVALARSTVRNTGTSWSFRDWVYALFSAAAGTILIAALGLLIVWAFHGFSLFPPFTGGGSWPEPVSTLSPPFRALVEHGQTVPLPAPVKGVLVQFLHARSGHAAFLMGERSWHGWWYYFPLVFVFKSTPAELLLAAALPFLLWHERNRSDATARLWVLTILVFGAFSVVSHLNIGARYILILWPLLVLCAIDLVSNVVRGNVRLLCAIAIPLVALQMGSAAAAAPGYLSFLNAPRWRPVRELQVPGRLERGLGTGLACAQTRA